MLRFLNAGESHGKSLSVIIEGLPAGMLLQPEDIDRDLKRRQVSYGRGGRMEIEDDKVDITAGVRWGKTLGSPVCLVISNKDWVNWHIKMSLNKEDEDKALWVTRPRPGHADLAGALKYQQKDVRTILERSSARETATRVAVGAVCKAFLQEFTISFYSYTKSIGGIEAHYAGMPFSEIVSRAEKSELRCADEDAEKKMKSRIDEARQKGDTLGGIVEIVVTALPPGLGSHVHWDRKLDGRIAQSLMSIQAVKGVEIGLGFESANRFGSQVHDEIFYEPPSGDKRSWGFFHKSNHAGGIEGGITNGEPLVVRCAMKPISTLMKPLKSVDLVNKEPVAAAVERSDICRVPSLAVIGESVVAFEVARAFLEKFGGDSIEEVRSHYQSYLERLRNF
ncbi:MAG TPA: chorismate synthase [Thermodesulfobacteriota bacterium]|nr:chorismate synthase [Thermodesulfobacteriota bacterium]